MTSKVYGEERRQQILQLLRTSPVPLTGSGLAKKMNVSRQVIVQDISLLKAKSEPIMATSQGYIYMHSHAPSKNAERLIACVHTPEQTAEEMRVIVDHGAAVKDVMVEHPVYGDLTASIMVHNRKEVEEFIEKITSSQSFYLSQLTEGVHMHTIAADSESVLDDVCQALDDKGFLIKDE
ncbi:transcription repressor NadR [Metabacillus sp. KIGAM252]|uniref:Transcription repressor NadR n=1 Tax=Metabacillus flavus TaxID=2823519 RepID=A0ABS5LGW8_9BACI|nr:transcription repressor NadR [Metabacillus flavus]MBS2969861.1 transcription repressor NadR [Metabacillus flavus]